MQYTYEFELFKSGGVLIAYPFDMDGATQGRDVKEAALMAADWLRADIEHRLMYGIEIPTATFGNQPAEGGTVMVVSVEAAIDHIKRVSAAEAARMLGVSPGRVTHMIKAGLLEAFKDGHRAWVTLHSVEARLSEPHPAGRPRKQAVTV
jgi:hypothetical protein